MRRTFAAFFIVAAGAGAAGPALATQGLSCSPVAGSGPRVGIVLGSLGIAGANLFENGANRTTMGDGAPLAMRQAWIDEQRLWIDLSDADHMRSEGRLRLAWSGSGARRRLSGTFVRNGRLYRMRCEED